MDTAGRASLRWRGIRRFEQRKGQGDGDSLRPNRVSLGTSPKVRGITRLLKEFRIPVYLSTIETPARNLPKNEI
jgi:hypothetical protein